MKSKDKKQDPRLLRNDFSTDNIWGIPPIHKNLISLDDVELVGYNNVKDNSQWGKNKMVHFFVDDDKFNSSFDDAYAHVSEQLKLYDGNSFRYVKKLAHYSHVITPDFSLRPEMPRWVQLMATAKSRWVGAYWQSKSLSVIPSVSWSDESSFDFCFMGIEQGSIVALSTVGNRRHCKEFLQGYMRMLDVVRPQAIICYGQVIDGMKGNIIQFAHPFNVNKEGVA